MDEPVSVAGADDPLQSMVAALLRDPNELTAEALRRGTAALLRYLQGRFSPPLAPAELEEIAADAVTRLMERRELLDPQFAPTGYLIRIASNAALAAIRRTRRTVPVDTTHPGFLALTDAQACARLHDSATPELIQDAMTQAYGQRDATAIRVATYLLDEIQRTGKAPSNRAAAQALGLSHEGVGKALRRLRTYLVASRRGY